MKNLIFGLLLGLMFFGSASADSHTTTGVIEQVDNNGKTLIIHHQEFPGFMGAMTMPFELKYPAMSEDFKAGDEVEFTIQKTETGYPIVSIKKTGGS